MSHEEEIEEDIEEDVERFTVYYNGDSHEFTVGTPVSDIHAHFDVESGSICWKRNNVIVAAAPTSTIKRKGVYRLMPPYVPSGPGLSKRGHFLNIVLALVLSAINQAQSLEDFGLWQPNRVTKGDQFTVAAIAGALLWTSYATFFATKFYPFRVKEKKEAPINTIQYHRLEAGKNSGKNKKKRAAK